MQKALWIGCAVLLVVGIALTSMTGCDDVQTQAAVFTVVPDGLSVTGLVTIAFAVQHDNTNQTIYLPLQWRVADARLGTIAGQGGLSAIYAGQGVAGINTIEVTDAAERRGFATVNHLAALGLELKPGSTNLAGRDAFAVFTVTANGDVVLPLAWSVLDDALGSITPTSAFAAIYESTGLPGYNTIVVTDGMGAGASAVVTQTE